MLLYGEATQAPSAGCITVHRTGVFNGIGRTSKTAESLLYESGDGRQSWFWSGHRKGTRQTKGMLRTNMKKCAWLWLFISGEISFAQVSAKIDFRRDVQPLFREHCVGCHGPTQQMNGFRLDQRRYVMPNRLGANGAAVAPGNSAKSRLYLKLTGSQNGPQMPPAGSLPAEQIEIVKAWIDQGAEWPDDLSGETPVSPPDPKAVRLMEALRDGDKPAFEKLASEDPKVGNRKGPGGATPLMQAVLYGDLESVRLLLAHGADANLRNEVNATAL